MSNNAMPTTKRRVDSDGPDFYPTPAWCTEALLRVESFQGTIHEPACGDGAISKVLEDAKYSVLSSDLYHRGFGLSGVDFLRSTLAWKSEDEEVKNIITNPPYALAEKFVLRALSLAKYKVAFLLRLAFLESTTRHKSIFSSQPPTRVWIFSERVTMYPTGVQTAGSGTTAYAWFVWESALLTSDFSHFLAPFNGETTLGWIPPGAKPKAPKRLRVPQLGLKLSDLGLGSNDIR